MEERGGERGDTMGTVATGAVLMTSEEFSNRRRRRSRRRWKREGERGREKGREVKT